MKTMNEILAGTVGGVAGALAMSVGMMVGKQAGVIKRPPPLEVEHELEQRAGVEEQTSPGEEQALAQGLHLLFGAGFGACYGLLRRAFDLPAIPTGPLYGLGVYAFNLAGVGPALGLTAGPWHEQPMTVGNRIMLHLVYGVVTALVSDRVRRQLT